MLYLDKFSILAMDDGGCCFSDIMTLTMASISGTWGSILGFVEPGFCVCAEEGSKQPAI